MPDTQSITLIRERIRSLANADYEIHLNVSLTHPKVDLHNVKAKIIGVYPHLFQIQESDEKGKKHTLQYADILMRRIEIIELNKKISE